MDDFTASEAPEHPPSAEDLFGEEELPLVSEDVAVAGHEAVEMEKGDGVEGHAAAESGGAEEEAPPADQEEDVDALFEPVPDEEEAPLVVPEAEAELEEGRVKREVPTARAPPIGIATPQPGSFPPSSKILLARLPNVLSIEPKPFDPVTYEEEPEILEVESTLGGGRKVVRLAAEHVIRWRYAYDDAGRKVLQSNARLAQWPDGTFSLHLGKDVLLATELPRQDSMSVVYATLPVSALSAATEGQESNYPSQVHLARGLFRGTLQFKPSSIESDVHLKLKNKIAEKQVKQPKIKRTNVLINPEEQQKIAKDVEAAERKRKRRRELAAAKRAASERFDASFLEEDEDELAAPLSARRIKDEDEEAEAEQRLLRAKRGSRVAHDDDLGSEEELFADDSDSSPRRRKKSRR